jgi:subtilisin family serine protease
MNNEDKYKIISNDFADLLIEYNDNFDLLTKYGGSSYNIIDRRYAIVHFPASNMTSNSIFKYGYSSIPSCYGLVSAPTFDSSGINHIRNTQNVDLKGQGVLVGFVDTGIDYTHKAFRNEDNTTRIYSIWDQSLISEEGYPKDYYYGTEFTRDQINHALNSENPFLIVPSKDENGHGTMMAGITAGSNIPEVEFTGIVPEAELVIVKLKRAKPYLLNFFSIPTDAIAYQENDIMMGVKYLLDISQRLQRPIVICIGLGSSLGDHSGRSMISSYLSYISDRTGTSVVIAAGNEGNRGHHYYGDVLPTEEYDVVELTVGSNESGFTMELLGSPPSLLWVNVYAPNGEFVARIPPTLNKTQQIFYSYTVIWVDSQGKELLSNEQIIVFRFRNPIPGNWRFVVYSQSDIISRYHIWLPITGFITDGTFFINPNLYTTVTSPGNSNRPIVVTAYDHDTEQLYVNASRGYTVLDDPVPNIAAPGVNILCPTPNNSYTRSTGTSFAAAHTAGVAAMLLEWGIVQNNLINMNGLQVKKILIEGADRNPSLTYPNPDWGYGKLDIAATYKILIESSATIQETSFYTRTYF